MKLLYGLILLWGLSSSTLFSQSNFQEVSFLHGKESLEKISPENLTIHSVSKKAYFKNSYHLLLKVDKSFRSQLRQLESQGSIRLGTYLGQGIFRASVSSNLDFSDPSLKNITFLEPQKSYGKLDPDLIGVSPQSTKKVRIIFASYMDDNDLEEFIHSRTYSSLRDIDNSYHIYEAEVPASEFNNLAELPFITRIEAIHEDAPLKLNSPYTTRTNTINVDGFGTSMGLTGNGVVVGVGDAGEITTDGPTAHIDRNYKIHNETTGILSGWGFHGEHIVGSIAGLGNKDPRYKGMAPQAEIVTEKSSNIIYRMDDLRSTYGISLVNCSFGPSGNSCENFGTYNGASAYLDYQMDNYEDLLYVVAAGNSGSQSCNGYGAQYNTVLQSYASAKNALVVGACDKRRRVYNSSVSAGPVKDGRLKPEISSPGTNITSTAFNNSYTALTGSSMATANVTGTLAVLTEQYKLLNNGTNPDGGLLKAIACNTASDQGRSGPDFVYGFGVLNARRASQVIQNNSFLKSNITDSATKTHSISVPAGTYQVNVMLYWQDQEGDPSSAQALINDLDLEVSKGAESYLPWVLDHTPGNERDLPTRKADHLNNIEQVTFHPQSSGNYTISINGFDIPSGSQDYYLVWEFIQESITITYPFGGEKIEAGEFEPFFWDAFGDNYNDVNVEYSIDGGGSWTSIPAFNNSSNDQEYTRMLIPTVQTSKALLRASINGTNLSDQSDYFFTIASVPENFSVNSCGGLVHLSWDEISDIAGYEILMRDTTMKVIETTATNSAVIRGLNPGEEYWFAVRSKLKDGGSGIQTIAMNATISNSTCANFDDAAVESISQPQINGRKFTSSALSENEDIVITLSNTGYQTLNSIPLNYQINSNPIVSETWTGLLAPGEKIEFTFQTKADLSAEGTYTINAWTTLSSDANVFNDQVLEAKVIKQLSNDPVMIPSSAEDFETASSVLVFSESIGVGGVERADFITSASQGRVRTNAGSSFTSGSRAITLDAAVDGERTVNELIMTYNMDGQNHPELYLSFDYMHHDQDEDEANAVFIRGNDNDTWIKVYDLDDNQDVAGIYKSSGDIELISALSTNDQTLSSSFQVKFCQAGSAHALDHFSADGYTFDNVELSDVSLAVDLVYFEASVYDDREVVLEWGALSEEDFHYYQVEVAVGDEAYLKEEFQILDKVSPYGEAPSDYKYFDTNVNPRMIRYYRLKMVDLDGTYEYSPVRSVRFLLEEELEMIVFPNPVAEELSFYIDDLQAGNGSLIMSDLSGRTLLRSNLVLDQDGSLNVNLPIPSQIATGYYFVHVEFGNKQITKKILRVKRQP